MVDEELGKTNPDIIDFKHMKDDILEDGVVIIASDNPMIYRELRLLVEMDIPREKVVDCFDENPLIWAKEPRLAALALASKQIYANHIERCVAEADVYQGDFARYINALFPNRKLYLFDTFCGFEAGQVNSCMDNISQTEQWIDGLKDTTADNVLRKMKYPNQVVIKQGIFPGTTKDINEKYAFVNLDMDLYEPTYEGLIFFWEQMSPGGYIFVHDFDNWGGIRASVLRFCKEKSTMYICLNDRSTVCIAKPMI